PVIAGNHGTSGTKISTVGTIVDVAAGNSSFKTLVTAVKAAGLVEVLSGKGPFTVFAPTDKAFAALPKGTLESLLKPENRAKLQKVLTYHVVPGSVLSTAIKPGTVKTVEGGTVRLTMKGNRVMVNGATVTTADVKASNGVIHVIDKVLLPPGI
ncbi:MAG: fasciclin domain-containing protein, partial [Leptolyngbyaceae cyanobacterium bins.59]|nr:fasciclin domain-containing protein [Leptolyngbyaceae cyanobacterium bins.59]